MIVVIEDLPALLAETDPVDGHHLLRRWRTDVQIAISHYHVDSENRFLNVN